MSRCQNFELKGGRETRRQSGNSNRSMVLVCEEVQDQQTEYFCLATVCFPVL